MPLTPMQNNTQESWEEAFDKKFKNLHTNINRFAEECDCDDEGTCKEKLKSFIHALLQKQAEEISEAVWDLLKTPKYNEAQTYDLGVKHAIAAIKQVINK